MNKNGENDHSSEPISALIEARSALVLHSARAKGLRLATVESCTGGLIVAALTAIAGASDVVEGGFVTYANRAKMTAVGVSESLLAHYGAVSAEVAIAMAEGGLRQSKADMVISVTGVAGPGGGTPAKPVGLVHFAIASHTQPTLNRFTHFDDLGRFQFSFTHSTALDRTNIRQAAVLFALDFLLDCIS